MKPRKNLLRYLGLAGAALACMLFMIFKGRIPNALGQEEEADPAEVAIGERLFLETRFAQFSFSRADGDAKSVVPTGEPTTYFTTTTGAPLPGPFAGTSMNCRSCHLVDEQKDVSGGGNRTYADFARRSPVPPREDGKRLTPRNSP